MPVSIFELVLCLPRFSSFSRLKDAIKLCKIWLYQRDMQQSQGQVDGFLMTMIMIALIQLRRLNIQMSSYQLFKATLQYLGIFL